MSESQSSLRVDLVRRETQVAAEKFDCDYDRDLIAEELAEVLCFLAKYKIRPLEIEGHSYPYASLGNLSVHISGRDFARIFRRSECVEQASTYVDGMVVLIVRVSTWSVIAALTAEEASQC